MKMKHKALVLAACAVLLVAASVLGTMAYLTSTDTATNTFTVGSVKIKLDEADYDDSTKGEERDTANKYHLLPGQSYTKDPTVKIIEDSESSYVRMLVKVQKYSDLVKAFPKEKYPTWYNGDNLLLQYLVNGWDETVWVSTKTIKVDAAKDIATYEFRYAQPVAGPANNNNGIEDGQALDALFDEIVIPGTVNNTELAHLQNVTIVVEAHAIQEVGFENKVEEAWAAFDGQYNN